MNPGAVIVDGALWVAIPVAILAGLVSFVSPCVLPLVPGYLGYLGYKQTKTAADYLVAGRSAHPVVMALSYGATFISTSAIVGFGGAAANLGMGVL